MKEAQESVSPRSLPMSRKTCLILAVIAITTTASPFAVEHIIIEKPVEMRHAKGIALGPYGGGMGGGRGRVFFRPGIIFYLKISCVGGGKMRRKLREETTKADGGFRFYLPPRKYEVRLTKDRELFDPLSFVLVVGKGFSKQGICIYMRPESGPGGTAEPCDIAHPPDKE